MKVSRQVAAELEKTQLAGAQVVDDEKVLKQLDALGSVILDADDKEAIEGAIALIRSYNALLLEVEERRGEAIRGFRGQVDIISEMEMVIGGDLDLSMGFACLRTEEGDRDGDLLVYVKGDFLGAVQSTGEEYKALVKRDGEITTEIFDAPEKAMVSVIRRTSDRIALELLRLKEK